MSTFKAHKVVADLPENLDPSALYFVRSGSGFDLFVTNNSGYIAAYPMNQVDRTLPYYIPEAEVFTVNDNRPALMYLDIIIDGTLELNGALLEV